MEPQARDKTRGRLCEDLPTCYIEEVPYMIVVSQRTCAVMVHHTDIASMDKDEASAEVEKSNAGEADTKGMHARSGDHPLFLHAAHLERVFELRGKMVDQEHRSILMGQHLDMLLDAYFNALTNRKCPMCTQPFSFRKEQRGRGTRMTGHQVFELVFISLLFNLVVQSQDNILSSFLVSFGEDIWRNNILVFSLEATYVPQIVPISGKIVAHLVVAVPLYLFVFLLI
jgi:hypothetical protein